MQFPHKPLSSYFKKNHIPRNLHVLVLVLFTALFIQSCNNTPPPPIVIGPPKIDTNAPPPVVVKPTPVVVTNTPPPVVVAPPPAPVTNAPAPVPVEEKPAAPVIVDDAAIRVADFLNSIGVNSSLSGRGETLPNTIKCVKYLGVRWIRGGYEGNIPIQDLITAHSQTGVRFSYGLGSGGTDIPRLLNGARSLAASGTLIAIEGDNEPNNFGPNLYKGEKRGNSWMIVAKIQRDLYAAVKGDSTLKKYPVWSISENGAETDNVGLQYLTIPAGAGTLMPDGTKYADYANIHNYLNHPSWKGWHDNMAWRDADPTSACPVDGLYGNYGLTWAKHFSGYGEAELAALPRVTTETGRIIDEDPSDSTNEDQQAALLPVFYLDQFKQGCSYTCVYLLRDRSDEKGNQRWGFYRTDYSPRKSALLLHNLTTILADTSAIATPGKLKYSIPDQPITSHDMLLQKHDGKFELVVWNERFGSGSVDNITVNLLTAYPSVKVYEPSVGTAPTQTLNNVNSVSLKLSNNIAIIEIPAPTP